MHSEGMRLCKIDATAVIKNDRPNLASDDNSHHLTQNGKFHQFLNFKLVLAHSHHCLFLSLYIAIDHLLT